MDAHTCGDTKAALTPAKNLNVSIHKKLGAIPQKNVLIAKKLIPSTITFFLFNPSDIGPAISANPAYPKAYELTIHPDNSVET
ncbi:Uncharacterised protein [Streptococcus pneumoniae]|nr:Uncharacterised protein [Streptococcus pneumoniae]